jgi:hypothetical protein
MSRLRRFPQALSDLPGITLVRALLLLSLILSSVTARAATNDFPAVQAVFKEHCLDCHAAPDPEGKLLLESFETMMKGGASGPVIVPGNSSESLLVKMIQGAVEKGGKKLIMPPGKREKLSLEQIALIKQWIDAGALPPPTGQPTVQELVVPKITPKVPPRRPINALAYTATGDLLAVGTFGEVVLQSPETHALIKTLEGHHGNVNSLAFSADGARLFAASGEAALFGEVREWNVAEGKLVKTFRGHRDTLYAVALSPDGKTLATGGYDQKIKLWDVESGKELETLSGHNGAVFGLAFGPDGKLLASASGDRTVKLWDVATGERRDTLSQSLKELYTVQFSPDGKRLAAAGADNRIRVWEISEQATETTNPLLISKFAHEGAILRIAFSKDGKTLASAADDETVKLWETSAFNEILSLPPQTDWPVALAFAAGDKILAVGALDGSLEFYDAGTGKPMPPAKPELVRLETARIPNRRRVKRENHGQAPLGCERDPFRQSQAQRRIADGRALGCGALGTPHTRERHDPRYL